MVKTDAPFETVSGELPLVSVIPFVDNQRQT